MAPSATLRHAIPHHTRSARLLGFTASVPPPVQPRPHALSEGPSSGAVRASATPSSDHQPGFRSYKSPGAMGVVTARRMHFVSNRDYAPTPAPDRSGAIRASDARLHPHEVGERCYSLATLGGLIWISGFLNRTVTPTVTT